MSTEGQEGTESGHVAGLGPGASCPEEKPSCGPRARLTPPGLCFLTCEMGTVTVPWFLGLNGKAPRTGWHRGCPQPCCLFPSPGGCGSRGE